MKIARCSDGGAPFWGVVDTEENSIRPLAGALADWSAKLTEGRGEGALRFEGSARRLSGLRLLPPIEKTSKVMVIGANYMNHLAEAELDPPKSPAAFMKPYQALIGAEDEIIYPKLTEQLDYEVELVVVVGACFGIEDDPYKAILGYTVGNDVSARDLQAGSKSIGMDLFSAKGLNRTTGVGPWIVTRDEFGDQSPDLRLTTIVNGETRQDGRTNLMRWKVGELLSYVNARSTLEPGDIMFTGTPSGVAWKTGRFLNVGDVVEASVEKIGSLRNVVARAA